MESFILVHPQKHHTFILPELHALLHKFNGEYRVYTLDRVLAIDNDRIINSTDVLHFLTASKEAVDYLLSRSMLISRILYVPHHNESLEEFFKRMDPLIGKFKISITSYIRKISQKEKISIMYQLESFLKDKEVDLSNPDTHIEMLETDNIMTTGILYGESKRKSFCRYELKNREFIGTTAMDNELSFIMGNLSGIKEGSIVLDCFAGTGSILIPCAVLGAYVIAADSNPKQFRGLLKTHANPKVKTLLPNKDIFSNFLQYNLKNHLLLVCISDIFSNCIFSPNSIDAIICDPPYGNRESFKLEGVQHDEGDTLLLGTLPFIRKVFEISEKCLKPNGAICFFLPHSLPLPSSLDISPSFYEVYRCFQYLNSVYSRTLLLYRKHDRTY
ncbi:tRNA (guanine10-N2)-methyltransferase [Nematocida sp. LUAm3]|nr:tRNA (guanine10-N2)-methyltransferase [Nematocida sp. LUAm3]KAI5176115.1 tRNA (guanine10-N2)-methyltransferase [Nematocida sp. LUAm2]KAI5179003.1 tRNA (guanine10-N2)-methyltransferase [Nematocida sp. LUAm1]